MSKASADISYIHKYTATCAHTNLYYTQDSFIHIYLHKNIYTHEHMRTSCKEKSLINLLAVSPTCYHINQICCYIYIYK